MLFNVQDPQFGDTVVQAAKFEDVESIYKTYLQSINATSTGSQIGISQAQNAPIGAHLITQFNNKGTLVGKIGDASSPLSFAKVKNLANMSSDDFFGNLYSPSTKGTMSGFQDGETDRWGSMGSMGGGGGGGGGGGAGDIGDFGDISDTAGPTEAFGFRPAFEAGLRQSGIDVRGGGGVRGALANQAYDPLLSRATLSAAFNPLDAVYDPEATQESLLGDNEGLTFRNYLKNQATGNSLYGAGGAQAARGLFEQARNLSGDPLAALKAMGEGGGISGQFLKPATIGQGATLANVAREGGRQRFGSFARFLPSAQDLTQTYLSYAPEAGGSQNESFADFLNKRIYGGQ
tara:strand:+ start:47 stop:1087 length:1041 start_codon:yes stop_codon:yes gene_type:complete